MPASSFHATVNQQPREIFMSFALLNRMTYLVGAVEHVDAIMINPEMREAVLKEMLSERTPAGKLVGDKITELEDVEISLEDTRKLLAFVVDHLLDFFNQAVRELQALTVKYQPPVPSK